MNLYDYTDCKISLEELVREADIISMEAMNPIQSLKFDLNKRLKSFFNRASKFITSRLEESEKIVTLSFNKDYVSGAIDNVSYTEMVDIQVFIPVGLSSTFDEYSTVLVSGCESTSELIDKTLVPFQRWVGSALGDPRMLKKVVGPEIYKYAELDKRKKEFTKCLKSRSKSDRAKYGEVVKRNADWKGVVSNITEATELHYKVGYKQIRELTDRVAGDLDTLIDRMEEDPMTYAANKRVISDMVDTTKEVARLVEFHSYVGYRLVELINAVNDTIGHVGKLAKKMK